MGHPARPTLGAVSAGSRSTPDSPWLRFDHLAIRLRASSGCLTAIVAAMAAPSGSRARGPNPQGREHEAITLASPQAVMSPDAYGAGGGKLRGALFGDGRRRRDFWLGRGAGPGSVAAGPALASRFGALRLEAQAGLGRAGHSLAERLSHVAHAGPGRRGGFVVLGGSPGAPVADTKTGTVYVPIQCTTSSCTTPEHVVDILNAAKCNAKVISGCRVVARAKAGRSPTAAAIDPRTNTVYVTNGGSNTVSVLNGARCNARVIRGCSAGGDDQGGKEAGRCGRPTRSRNARCM